MKDLDAFYVLKEQQLSINNRMISLKTDGITINIDARQFLNRAQMINNRLAPGMLMVSQTMALKIQEWAQENRAWTDRTGNARQTLNARAYLEGSHHVVISLAHGVEYGIWLELANNRKYAILNTMINSYTNN